MLIDTPTRCANCNRDLTHSTWVRYYKSSKVSLDLCSGCESQIPATNFAGKGTPVRRKRGAGMTFSSK